MKRKKNRKRKIVKVILIVLALIVAVRLALPYVILHYANKNLAEMDGYNGHIEDIDLAIIRGAYKLISMTDVDVVALNLKNSYDSAAVLPARIDAQATIYDGRLDMGMRLNPLADVPTFDLNAEWKRTNLVKLNEFFQAYAKVDVNKGTFGLYAEVAAKEGSFTGYVKPLIEDIDVLGMEDRKDNILRKAWEGISGAITEIFENQKEETFATKIPLKGEIENPKANIFFAILQILENAFISALQPSIDQQINLGTVDQQQEEGKGFLEKVFRGKDKQENDKKKGDGDKKN